MAQTAVEQHCIEGVPEAGGLKCDVTDLKRNSEEGHEDRHRSQEEAEDDVSHGAWSVMLHPLREPSGALQPQTMAKTKAVGDGSFHFRDCDVICGPAGRKCCEPEQDSSDDRKGDGWRLVRYHHVNTVNRLGLSQKWVPRSEMPDAINEHGYGNRAE